MGGVNLEGNRAVFKKICILFCLIILLSNFSNIKPLAEVNENNIVIVLDVSESMQENDKEKLAIVAGKLLLDSINSTSPNVSIVTFAGEVYKNKTLNDKPSIEELKEYLSTIEYNKKNTNLNNALKEGINQLSNLDGDKRIIVLSDGKEEPIGGLIPDTHKKELDELLSKAKDKEIKIETIGFTEAADKENLNNISIKTGGNFLFAKNTEDIFRCFNHIISKDNEFITIEDYNTTNEKKKTLKLTNMVEEVNIKVASCDNKTPQVEVKLNGEKISASKGTTEDMHRIYNIKNNENRKLEITAEKDSNVAIIVEIKSKATINSENFERNIDIPKGTLIDLRLAVDSKGEKISDVYIEKLKGNLLIDNIIGSKDLIFNDNIDANEIGEIQILYVAKEKDGGIIAARELYVLVNTYPSYDYSKNIEAIMQGEKFIVNIQKNSDKDVTDLNGSLIIDVNGNEREIPLKKDGDGLKGEIILDNVGEFNYRASINGSEAGKEFSYQLPSKIIKVTDKANIELSIDDIKENNIIIGNTKEVTFNLHNIVIYTHSIVEILDKQNNKIGEFNIKPDDIDSKVVEIKPVSKEENIVLYFKTSDEINITKEIETNLNSLGALKYYWEKIDIVVIPVVALIIIITLLFIIGNKAYKRNMKIYTRNIAINYTISGLKSGLKIPLIKGKENKVKYSYENESLELEEKIDIHGENIIAFKLEEKLSTMADFIKGLGWIVKKEEMFVVSYNLIVKGEVRFKGKAIAKRGLYKKGMVVTLLKNEESIRIEFK